MSCGCGGRAMAQRPVKVTQPSNDAVLRGVAHAPTKVAMPNPVNEERLKIEKRRREAILKALQRPS